jgi:hypothetical protein
MQVMDLPNLPTTNNPKDLVIQSKHVSEYHEKILISKGWKRVLTRGGGEPPRWSILAMTTIVGGPWMGPLSLLEISSFATSHYAIGMQLIVVCNYLGHICNYKFGIV